jgi:nitrite reductase (NADH) small subunit
MSWTEIGALEDIPKLGSRVVNRLEGRIGVFRTADDEVFALDDRCPHKGGPLSQGIVFDRRVACPLHDWVIDLEQGCALGPDEGCVQSYRVKVESGRVFIALSRGTRETEPIDECEAMSG